jgi:hypothetical protein
MSSVVLWELRMKQQTARFWSGPLPLQSDQPATVSGLARIRGTPNIALMNHKECTRRYWTAGAGAGLVRVEVIVPTQDRDVILKMARRHRDVGKPPSDEARAHIGGLHARRKTQSSVTCPGR